MAGRTKHVVLLVEDDATLRDALTGVLERSGWEVLAEANSTGAIKRFASHHVDVVLSDLLMPGGGGAALLEQLRLQDQHLAFMIMSGHLTIAKVRSLLIAGACDCLAKPVTSETLLRALDRALLLRRTLTAPAAHAITEQLIELTVPASAGRRSEVLRAVDDAAQAAGFDPRRNRILLALDEAFVNAVRHGAALDATASVTIRASFSVHGGVVTVSDPGPGFDPVIASAGQDVLQMRSGLFLIKAACDDVHWLGRGNVCQMVFRQPGTSGQHRPVIPRGSNRIKVATP